MTGRSVKSIKGIHALHASARPFVLPLGNGEVAPMYGAEIVELDSGKYLARLFNGVRWVEEVMEIRDIAGMPTLIAAAS